MRAGIAMLAELPYSDDRGEPIIGAVVPGLEPRLTRGQRLIEMLCAALTDCLGDKPGLSTERIPLLVGLAEPNRPGSANLAATVVKAVQEKLGRRFHPQHSRGFAAGHTAGFEALKSAQQLLTDSTIPGCLVCGVDSYINAGALRWLDEHWRLKRETNSNGVIPGEAAAVVFVQATPPDRTKPQVRVSGLGFAVEKAAVLTEEPLLGLGLAEAARSALKEADHGLHEVDFRLSDVTGESYGFKEQALMLGRLMRVRREELPLWHVADSIGDIGAAAGVAQLVVAQRAFHAGYAPGGRVLCCTSSVPGGRAVAVLENRSR
jgi:3-oxoacyl-[acyl-carrier-protein] synthase-1